MEKFRGRTFEQWHLKLCQYGISNIKDPCKLMEYCKILEITALIHIHEGFISVLAEYVIKND